MITKNKLLSPPSDLQKLERLEARLVNCAHKYISEIIQISFDVNTVRFDCTLDDSFAFARYDDPNGNYSIQFGRTLTSAILNFSESISDKLSSYIEWNKRDDIIEFIFSYISWSILNHELAHITCGHLDFIQEHGESGYYEVNERKTPIKHLAKDLAKSRDFWQALESEADGNAISTTLVSFKYVNSAIQWRLWNESKALNVHGVINSLMFYFLNVLMEGTDDFRHPKPYVRQYLSLPSIDSLAEKLNHSRVFYTDTLIKANFDTVLKILELKLPISYMIESVNWMNRLDEIIKETGISSYRRRKKN